MTDMLWHRSSATCCSIIYCLIVLLAAAAVTADHNVFVNSKCGTNPDKVDDIPAAEESSSTNFSITVGWAPPDSDKPFNYILECADCRAGIVNTTQQSHRFTNLSSATVYNMSIRAELTGCNQSSTLHFAAKTRLASLRGTVSITDVTETTLIASWMPSIDVGVTYEVSWDNRSKNVTSTSTVCDGLTSGSEVTVTVRAFKIGFQYPTLNIRNTALTKLYAVDANAAQISATASNISVSWKASKTDGVSYKLTCSGAAGDKSVETVDTNATCQPLESGQSYRVTVTVQKAGGYEDAVTNLGTHLIKPTLSTDVSNFNVSVTVTDKGDISSAAASAAVQLTVKWTEAAATGADVMLVTVTSELNSELNVTSNGSFTNRELQVTQQWFFSQNLTVTVTAVADKGGLTAHSQDKFVTSKTTEPNRPTAMLTPEKRSITVTLTATSNSESLHASINGSPVMKHCSPAAPIHSCSVNFTNLTPFTNYSVEAWAEFQTLTSQLSHQVTATQTDIPSQPVSLSVKLTSPVKVQVDWCAPKEPNGIITNYTVHWWMLDIVSGSELPGQNESTIDTKMELEKLASGQQYSWKVAACTSAGCGCWSETETALMEDAEPDVVTGLNVTVSNNSVHIEWNSLVHSGGLVFVYMMKLMRISHSEYGTAVLVNCTNCQRSEHNLTEIGKSGLDLLIGNSSRVNGVNRFNLNDSLVSVDLDVDAADLRPWTEYSVSLFGVNRAGPSESSKPETFRTPEAQSGKVRNLQVNQSESLETATVEFEEPEMKNGLLMAFAVQLFEAPQDGACLQFILLNVTEPEACKLVQCKTALLIDQLSSMCNDTGTKKQRQQQQQQPMKTGIAGLQPHTGYRVRVTPLSQTLLGSWDELHFGAPSVPGGGGSWVTVVVAVVVSVVVVAILCLLVLLLAHHRPHIWSELCVKQPKAKETCGELNGKSRERHEVDVIDVYV